MATCQLPSPEVLRQLLRYEPDTGQLFWLPRSEALFKDSPRGRKHDAISWNARFAGKMAGTICSGGYLKVSVFNCRHGAHRLAWMLHYGVRPAGVIDHINGRTDDNRIANLRDVTQVENSRNACLASNNTSGVNGVSWSRQKGKWAAYISHDGRQVHLGLFQTKAGALAARAAADATCMYHPNHGRSGGLSHG